MIANEEKEEHHLEAQQGSCVCRNRPVLHPLVQDNSTNQTLPIFGWLPRDRLLMSHKDIHIYLIKKFLYLQRHNFGGRVNHYSMSIFDSFGGLVGKSGGDMTVVIMEDYKITIDIGAGSPCQVP